MDTTPNAKAASAEQIAQAFNKGIKITVGEAVTPPTPGTELVTTKCAQCSNSVSKSRVRQYLSIHDALLSNKAIKQELLLVRGPIEPALGALQLCSVLFIGGGTVRKEDPLGHRRKDKDTLSVVGRQRSVGPRTHAHAAATPVHNSRGMLVSIPHRQEPPWWHRLVG